jgi:hypothetical protein
MKLSRLAILACTATLIGTANLSAQTLRTASEPAEFPPASYQGRQYVDSAGCVFVRAGVAGNITWVPRITRGRDQLCGFQPSLPRTAKTEAPAAQPAPAKPKTQTQTISAAPAPAQTVPAPRVIRQPAPVATAQPSGRTAPAKVATTRPATSAPLSALRANADPRPTTTVQATAPTTQSHATRIPQPDPSRTACANATGISAAYMVQHKGSPVRCGPQATPHVTYANRTTSGRPVSATPRPGTPATPETVPPFTRVAPARVYASQQASLAGVHVPAGMQPVWEDDRLNPYRAHQTFEGRDQMLVMWTNTVPQRLINRRTGADVIHQFPGLQPPYTSFEAQRAAGVTVSTQGNRVPEPVTVQRMARLQSKAQPTTAVISTRSVPDAQPRTAASHRYAQAGIFADPAQAQAAARRIARAGLPARRGTLTRDGRELTLVLAGPFTTQSQLTSGADRLRAMGFANVTLRK